MSLMSLETLESLSEHLKSMVVKPYVNYKLNESIV